MIYAHHVGKERIVEETVNVSLHSKVKSYTSTTAHKK